MQRTTVLPGIHSPLATLVHGASQCSGQHRLKLCGRCPRGPSPSRGTLARGPRRPPWDSPCPTTARVGIAQTAPLLAVSTPAGHPHIRPSSRRPRTLPRLRACYCSSRQAFSLRRRNFTAQTSTALDRPGIPHTTKASRSVVLRRRASSSPTDSRRAPVQFRYRAYSAIVRRHLRTRVRVMSCVHVHTAAQRIRYITFKGPDA